MWLLYVFIVGLNLVESASHTEQAAKSCINRDI